jgi:hypothetical protein
VLAAGEEVDSSDVTVAAVVVLLGGTGRFRWASPVVAVELVPLLEYTVLPEGSG